MRFEQTHEILDHIRDYHRSLSHCYDALEEKAGRRQVKLMLDYLADRERELADAINQFKEKAEPDVLDAWFQFADENRHLELACPVIDLEADMDVNDILALAQEAHDCLTRAFGEIAANCETPEVRDVFNQLSAQGETQWKALVRDAEQLSDW